MADFPSRLDLYAIGRDYVLQKATKIDPGQVDVLGSDVNIFVGSNSVVADTIIKQLAYSIARLFLDGAEGDDLDRLVFDRYGLTRKGASASLGSVNLTRATTAAGAGTIGVGTLLTTLTGVQYITTTAANFSITDLGVNPIISANVRATQAGKLAQVGTHAINGFAKSGTVFDHTLQVDNPLSTAGGEDAEDDDTFRARVRNFWNTARRGVLAAIEFGALTVPGVVSANAVEVITTGALPARIVNLYIADSSGLASQQLGALVVSALGDYRAAGITVVLNTSLPQIVPVVLALTFQAGIDTVTLGTTIVAAVVQFINSLPVNGALYLVDLYSVLRRFVSDGLIQNSSIITAPTGDVQPGIGQTLRTTLASVVLT